MYFPFFKDISNSKILIIGGGKIASQKLSVLLKFTDKITIVDENANFDGVKNIKRKFEFSDLDGFDMVVCCTNDAQLNAQISAICKQKKIEVNCVDDEQNCTFIFPSVIKKGDLTVAVSSGAKAPSVCKKMRQTIEAEIPQNIEQIINEISRYREELKQTEPSQKTRAEMLGKKLEELWSV